MSQQMNLNAMNLNVSVNEAASDFNSHQMNYQQGYQPVYLPTQYQSIPGYKDVFKNGPFKCDKCSAVFMLEVFYHLHKEKHLQSERELQPPQPAVQGKEDKKTQTGKKKKKARKRPKTEPSVKVPHLYCSKCQIYAGSIDELVKHMTEHSSSKQLNQCGNCEYHTTNRGNFKRHVMTHGNIRPFECPYCPFTASQKTHLSKHMTYHVGDRIHKCSDCSYNCSDKANFNKHKKVHSFQGPTMNRMSQHPQHRPPTTTSMTIASHSHHDISAEVPCMMHLTDLVPKGQVELAPTSSDMTRLMRTAGMHVEPQTASKRRHVNESGHESDVMGPMISN